MLAAGSAVSGRMEDACAATEAADLLADDTTFENGFDAAAIR
jgi:hypothetical protein